MTMQTVDMPTFKGLVKHVVFECNEPLMVLGPSGVGKTEGVNQVAEEMGAFLCTILLGQYDTVDLKGTPWVRKHDGGYQDTVWYPASTLPFKGNPAFPTDRPILLFFDEATSATVPVMGILYQLTQERRCGEHELMDNVHIVLSGNRASDKGIVNRMPSPLNDRIVFCEMGVSVEAWSTHAQKIGVKPECIAFLNWKKELLHTFDPAKPEFVFATPRSWVKAFKKFYASTTMSKQLKEAAMCGTVGDGPTTEFWAFVDNWRYVSTLIPSILKDPVGVPLPEKLDIQYALCVNLSGLIDAQNSELINKFLFRLPDDFTTLTWNLAGARDEKLYGTRGFTAYAKKCLQVWQP